jgi:hypothetical protein
MFLAGILALLISFFNIFFSNTYPGHGDIAPGKMQLMDPHCSRLDADRYEALVYVHTYVRMDLGYYSGDGVTDSVRTGTSTRTCTNV